MTALNKDQLAKLAVEVEAVYRSTTDLRVLSDGFALGAADADLETFRSMAEVVAYDCVVVSDTSLDYVLFEVTEERDLSEGRLVEARIGDSFVIFQIIEGLTREDIVQQKNTYGYARAKARKIGRWDAEAGKSCR